MIHGYHDGTKHQFHRFARSLGYLDWASQPNPFRSFAGAEAIRLPPNPQSAVRNPQFAAVADVVRHSLGLSAWKQFGASRWALRVNPSSGNLHPTAAYVIAGAAPGLGDTPGVYHYAPERHELERRCTFAAAAWPADPGVVLIALTSIHWREAWKYGERAFRYCQHDIGHAIAAIRIAAATAGFTATLLPEWSHDDIAALTGIDRDDDFVEAEREEPGCLMAISRQSAVGSHPSAVGSGQSAVGSRQSTVDSRQSAVGSHPSAVGSGQSAVDSRQSSVVSHPAAVVSRDAVLAAVRAGAWTGKASQLSEDHTTWSLIDEIAAATRDPGRSIPPIQLPDSSITRLPDRALILQRRSAVAFDGASSIGGAAFFAMLSSVMPRDAAPWDALWWDARIHLAIFVHRVDDVAPGLYLLVRNASALERLRAAFGREFLWAPAGGALPLYALALGDCRAMARRLSCDQDIAADGFFSLGMIAEFDAGLEAFGPSFYRQLFWESGVVGQVLYLEAEAAGARATGIGCFYDDPVHDVLGITGHACQSLYHFTVGAPVEDGRLTTEPGYPWEVRFQKSDVRSET